MTNSELKDKARQLVRNQLKKDQSYLELPVNEQKEKYHQLILNEMDNLAKGQSVYSTDFKKGPTKSSDLIDDSRHDVDFSEGIDSFEDVIESVDFAKFTGDLLKAVFDANISVMKAQTDDFIRLMKESTKSIASFIKSIDNTAAFAYLAENNPDEFNISMEDNKDGSGEMKLTKPDGEQVDIGDNEVKARIMEAKIKMAQEHKRALQEVMLMGVNQLVIERGEVETECFYEYKGHRTGDKADKAMLKTSKSSGNSVGNKGILGGLFGGLSGGHTASKQQTQLSVSTAKSHSEDDITARLRGKVNIKFKSNYFDLNNFADMYAPPSREEKAAAAGG